MNSFLEVAITAPAKSQTKYHQILEAAVTVFARHGFHQSTISQIARVAGVADGTIYLYFKNKDDIMVNFFEYKTRDAFESFREAVRNADSAVAKLRALINQHLDVFQNDPDLAVVYQAETHLRNRMCEPQIKEMSKLYRDIVVEIIEAGQAEGTMRKDLYIGLVVRFIIGAVDETINTWLHAETAYDLVSMADPLIDLFLKGIGSDEGTADR